MLPFFFLFLFLFLFLLLLLLLLPLLLPLLLLLLLLLLLPPVMSGIVGDLLVFVGAGPVVAAATAASAVGIAWLLLTKVGLLLSSLFSNSLWCQSVVTLVSLWLGLT